MDIKYSESPISNLAAEVIHENDCSYMYLYTKEVTGKEVTEKSLKTFSACWIKNHVFVGDSHSPKDDMQKGLQPKVNTKYCRYSEDLSLLNPDSLEIVWGEEGCTAGLYSEGELICVILYWATSNMPGYSKYSNTDNLSVYPLPLNDPSSNAMFDRMAKAKEFWSRNFENEWSAYEDGYYNELEKKYGKYINYFAIDGGKFPPKRLVIFEKDGYKYAFTIGLGIFPQPMTELHDEDYKNIEKMELAFCYHSELEFDEMRVFSQISSISNIPWTHKTFLDHNHTVGLAVNREYNAAVLIADSHANVADIGFLKRKLVNLLWIVPVADSIYAKLTAEPSDYSDVERMVKIGAVRLENGKATN